MRWQAYRPLAWAVQYAGQQSETAPVFLGERGTGTGSSTRFPRQAIFRRSRHQDDHGPPTSFPPIKAKDWSNEVDRALRAAREPVALIEEQTRRHGTDTWRDEQVSWLIRERLPEQGVGLLAGMYSTFKSFVLLDLCGSVMTGLPTLKAKVVRRGGVLIFAAEGARDLPMRMKALVEHRLAKETDDPDLFKRSKIDLGRLPFSYIAHCRPLLDPKTVEWMVAKALLPLLPVQPLALLRLALLQLALFGPDLVSPDTALAGAGCPPPRLERSFWRQNR